MPSPRRSGFQHTKFWGGRRGDKHSDHSSCHLLHLVGRNSVLSVSQENNLGATLDFSLFDTSGHSINYTFKTSPESTTSHPFTVTTATITCLDYCNNLLVTLCVSAPSSLPVCLPGRKLHEGRYFLCFVPCSFLRT